MITVDLLQIINASIDQLTEDGIAGVHHLIAFLEKHKDTDVIEVLADIPALPNPACMHDIHDHDHDHEKDMHVMHDHADSLTTLKAWGFKDKVIKDIFEQYNPDEICRRIEYTEFASEHGMIHKTKAAYFINSIAGRWREPKGFKAKQPWYAGSEELVQR